MKFLETWVSPKVWNFDIAIALFVAGVINLILGLFLYRGSGKILVDKKTGESTEFRPRHSFCFIPYRWYTVGFFAFAIYFAAQGFMAPPIPSYSSASWDRFESICLQHSNSKRKQGGNSPVALKIANEFQQSAYRGFGEHFQGRKIPGKLDNKNFTTYTTDSKDHIIVITDVERGKGFRRGPDGEALQKICWQQASRIVSENGISRDKELIILARDRHDPAFVIRGFRDKDFSSDTDHNAHRRIVHLISEEVYDPKKNRLPTQKTQSKTSTELRSWKNKAGKEMRAQFLYEKEGIVSFTKPDGIRYEFPFDQLSQADQDYIRSLQKE